MANTDKPFYVNPTGVKGPKDLPSSPPFAFHGVTARVFPLQADISLLTDFCDSYLNMDIPDEIVHFFPAQPYVYLAVLNYGSMSPLLFSAQNVGWISQEEVFFMIPLEVWRKENGKLVFKEWAFVSPFIFVNDSLSLTTGREVYGWAKILGHATKNTPRWLQEPTAPTRVYALRAPVFAKEYNGRREENRTLLEINCDAPMAFTAFPPNLGRAITALPEAAKAWLGVAGGALDMMAALPLRGYRTTRSLRTTLETARVGAGELLRLFPNPLRRLLVEKTAANKLGYGRMAEAFVNQITLKQFRSAGHPNQACYQSLVSSRMGLDSVNRFGLLGDYSALLGDPSGGYSIRLHEYDAYPIVDSLGLKVSNTEEAAGTHVAVLKPTMPFWVDVDLYYDVGKTICARHRGNASDGPSSTWKAESPLKWGDAPAEAAGQPAGYGILYNTVRGGSTQAIVGPFHFPDVTVQVYPLLASRGKLKEFIDQYLNTPLNPPHTTPSGLRFEPFGEYVYLMLESVGCIEGIMWSESNNIGWWSDKSVSFCVPVKMFKDGVLDSIALVTPYRFANDNRAVISDREVNGRISVMADIKALPDVWLDESGPVKGRKFLELSTEVLPALDVGAETENRVLLRINGELAEDYYNDVRWRMVGERWRNPLLGDLQRKTAYKHDNAELIEQSKALALQVFALKAPINWINLKQYRDAEFSERACYQSLVKVSRNIERVFDIREIEENLFVRITDLPDFPIVKTLGLQLMNVVSRDSVEQVLQPIRPFWMRLGMKEDLGETLAWRVREGAWNHTDALEKRQAEGGRLRVGRDLLDSLGGIKQRLQQKSTRWLFDALKEEADAIREELPKLPEPTRRRLLDLLEHKSRQSPGNTALAVALEAAQLAGIGDAAYRLKRLFRAISTHDLYEVVEAITCPLAGLGVKIGSRRFSAAEAKHWLCELGDVQTVIEPILSDEWEHWGAPRASENLDRKPDFCIPKDTFVKDGVFGLPPKEFENLSEEEAREKAEKFDNGEISLDGFSVFEKWLYYGPATPPPPCGHGRER